MKYYVAADVHGFYTEFHNALDEAGYFTNPEPHKRMIYIGKGFVEPVSAKAEKEVHNYG